MNRILNIVGTGYRATLEEQDDTVLWLTQAQKGAGADNAVLLRGTAANYVVRGHECAPLAFGDKKLAHPPLLDRDIAKIVASGMAVYVLDDDLDALGVGNEPRVDGVRTVKLADLPKLFEQYDQVWQW